MATPRTPRPMMFVEAPMPDGFPDPGPIGRVLLKHYPAYRAARVKAALVGESRMALTLYNHLQSKQIPSTAPVQITYVSPQAAEPSVPDGMLFIYPTPTLGVPGTAGKIEVVDVPSEMVVSITYRGSFENGYAACMPRLLAWLDEQTMAYQFVGLPRFLGYNSPLVPWFLQIGEVQIPVRAIAEKIQPRSQPVHFLEPLLQAVRRLQTVLIPPTPPRSGSPQFPPPARSDPAQ